MVCAHHWRTHTNSIGSSECLVFLCVWYFCVVQLRTQALTESLTLMFRVSGAPSFFTSPLIPLSPIFCIDQYGEVLSPTVQLTTHPLGSLARPPTLECCTRCGLSGCTSRSLLIPSAYTCQLSESAINDLIAQGGRMKDSSWPPWAMQCVHSVCSLNSLMDAMSN